MTKECIEREAAKARLRIWITDCVLYGDNDEADCFRRCIDLIDSIPAADVVEVVRCKDCLYSTERYGHMECIHGVSYRNTWNKPDFFCSYGERKEGADND